MLVEAGISKKFLLGKISSESKSIHLLTVNGLEEFLLC